MIDRRAEIVRQLQAVEDKITEMARLIEQGQDCLALVRYGLAAKRRLVAEEEWEFSEWCHGRTGRPMGYPHQAWSAGMYVFAYRCAHDGRVPTFWENGGE